MRVQTLYSIASRFRGLEEKDGPESNPMVLAMLKLQRSTPSVARFDGWPPTDSVPWCGAAIGFFCHALGYDVPVQHLRARSWLTVGDVVEPRLAIPFADDIVIIARDGSPVDETVLDAPGHVGIYCGQLGEKVAVYGGNQGDRLCEAAYPLDQVIGYRRLG